MTSENSELTRLLELSLEHAKNATINDEQNHLPLAVENYDKAILYLDEVLVTIARAEVKRIHSYGTA